MMTEEELANKACDAFQLDAMAWRSYDFHEHAATVVYYQAALCAIKNKPFRQEFVQIKVVAFLEMMLAKASENLLHDPLKAIQKAIQKLEDV